MDGHHGCACWQTALGILHLHVPPNEFETWIKHSRLAALNPATALDEVPLAIVETPNVFVRQEMEGRYSPDVEQTLQAVLGFTVQVQMVLEG